MATLEQRGRWRRESQRIAQENAMDTVQSVAALVADGPAGGQTAGGWDCIGRDRLRAFLADMKETYSFLDTDGVLTDESNGAIADMEYFVNQGA